MSWPSQHLVQRDKRRALLREQEHAGCVPVEPVHELQVPGLRAHGAQRLDHAVRHAAAAVHRDARRLVDGEDPVVFEDHRQAEMRRDLGVAALGHANRWDADAVARHNLLRSLHALAVDADFAAANDPIDTALRHALEAGDEVVVDPLAGLVLGNFDMANRGDGWGCFAFDRHAGYTIFLISQGDARSGARDAGQRRSPARHKSDGKRNTRARRTRIPRGLPFHRSIDAHS